MCQLGTVSKKGASQGAGSKSRWAALQVPQGHSVVRTTGPQRGPRSRLWHMSYSQTSEFLSCFGLLGLTEAWAWHAVGVENIH